MKRLSIKSQYPMPKQLKQAAERKKHSQHTSPGGLINSDVVSSEMFEEIDMSWIWTWAIESYAIFIHPIDGEGHETESSRAWVQRGIGLIQYIDKKKYN